MTPTQETGLSVLAVDDEIPAVEQMKWLLEADPLVATVTTATNVAEAQEVLARQRIDVVLLDIHMPGPTGRDLARQLRQKDTGDVPHVIFVTADYRPEVSACELDTIEFLVNH